jgi:3'(2'), 5'-bisphosphate nucleotidase
MLTNQDALDRLGVIVRKAGAAIMSLYGDAGTVIRKSDSSPLTAADKAAHDVIWGALRDWTPAIPILSEEGEVPSYAARRGWRSFWLVDPLDGTKEFLSRNGEFTVNVALIEHGEPVLGAVFAPALDLLYLAGRGLGAWRCERDGRRVRIVSAPPIPGAPVAVAESRSHPSPELEAYLASIPVKERVRTGSSLKFCLVAEGRADIYPRFGPTMEWDTAAGDCIFRYSGRDTERQSPLRYNTPTLRHEQFVIGAAG